MDTMNEWQQEIDMMVVIAEKCGATVVRNKEGQIEDIFFTPHELLRMADFLVNTTMENYEELKDSQAV